MHLIEIHEQPWCPASLRDALTDYLQFAIESGNPSPIPAPYLIGYPSADSAVEGAVEKR